MDTAEVDLSRLKKARDWRRDHAADVFRSDSSWEWFIKLHGRELIECGALIHRRGRAGSLVHLDRIGPVIQKILREESLKFLNDHSAVAA